MIKIDVTKTTTICGALGVDADRVVVLCEKAQEIAKGKGTEVMIKLGALFNTECTNVQEQAVVIFLLGWEMGYEAGFTEHMKAIASIAIRKINKPKAGSTQQVTPQGEA